MAVRMLKCSVGPGGGLLILALLVFAGCDSSQPGAGLTPDPASDQTAGASKDSELSPSNVQPEGDIRVNDEGHLVLGAEDSSGVSETASAVNEPSQPASNSQEGPAVDVVISAPDEVPVSERLVGTPTPAEPTPAEPTPAEPTPAEPGSSRTKSGVALTDVSVPSADENNQRIAEDWPKPDAVIYVSGQQHGYIEPCGCTGLERQKGGLIRRDTLLNQLRARGWDLIPVDVGNQVRRVGPQPEIKFQTTAEALKLMGYEAAVLGVDDLQLSAVNLIQVAGSDNAQSPGIFVCANVVIIIEDFFPQYRIVEKGGRKIGITGVVGKEHKDKIKNSEMEFFDPIERLQPVVKEMKGKGCDYIVLLAHASLEESREIATQVDDVDLVVTAGGYGEPTLLPEKIEGTKALMVQVGVKGMYGGIVGLFSDEEEPVRYQKIALSAQFSDSERMLERFAEYQERLKQEGFDKLGAKAFAHPTGRKFVGSEACADCHTTAYEIWEGTPHVHATEHIIAPNNDRGGIARHYDPECVSCHATGWEAQRYYPFATGFVSPEQTPLMMGSGCENCHGPGKDHVDAELGEVDVDSDTLEKLQKQMVIKLEHAKVRCLECHDLDNSPDFDFDKYWEKVKHYGKD